MLSQIHILTYIHIENDGKDPKPKDCYHVRISKFRTIFAKDYTLNWSEEAFLVKKVEIIYHGIVISMILMVKERCWNVL